MILEEAQTLALLHMDEWGLIDDFDFEFEDCKRTLGRCHYSTKKITLSKWFVELNKEEEIEDTILHEIAHALSWIYDGFTGHGRIWKRWAMKVGANPKRCSKNNLQHPQAHYKYVDNCGCGKTFQRHRVSKYRTYHCPSCKKSLFLSK
jgi:predicted SprT family Zn-dependent metalloprotease